MQLDFLTRQSTLTEPGKEAGKQGACLTNLEMANAGKAALRVELTPDQARILEEIVADVADPTPIQRLLQGDVRSGKTAVA